MHNLEKFCLKWNEFETNIRESFRELREEQNHFDVSLASDDGHQIEAHKIILSAGSKFFSDILRKTKHPSPYIYLSLKILLIFCTMVRLILIRKN